jgi:Tfp pilus assembly protein PilF
VDRRQAPVTTPSTSRVKARVARAELLLQLRRPADAEREARAALAEDPDGAGGHIVLALALSAQGDTDRALEEANRAVAVRPGAWLPHWTAGAVLCEAGRHREALAAFQHALACGPGEPMIYEQLARSHYALGEWTFAAHAAWEGVRLAPEDADLAQILALALVEVNDDAGALHHAARAVRLAPEAASAHRVYGLIAQVQGDHRAAADAFREALRLAPESGSHLLLGALKQRNPLHRLDRALTRVRTLPRKRIALWMAMAVLAPWFVFMLLLTLVIWVNWVLQAVLSLWMRRDPSIRLLLPDAEVRAARISVAAFCVGGMLITAGLWAPVLILGGIAVLALITPVQETTLLDGRSRTVFAVAAGALGAFLATLIPLALAAPHLEWVPVATLLSCYAALGSTWPAMFLRAR